MSVWGNSSVKMFKACFILYVPWVFGYGPVRIMACVIAKTCLM